MNIVFSEYKPPADLLPFVQSFWFGDFNISNSGGYTRSVVPNGCIELIIHLTTAHCALEKEKDKWNRSPDFTIVGMHTRPYGVHFESRVHVFGIRFFPDGIRNIFGVPPALFLSTFENGVDVLGKNLTEFCVAIRDSGSVSGRLQLTEKFIRTQLELHYRSYDYTHQMMKLIRSVKGQMRYRDMTEKIAISERQLQREFKNQYGITVEQYTRLARMNAVYRYMQSGSDSLKQVYNYLEFFDQSHFIREFRNYVGLPPGKFLKNRENFIVNTAL